MAIKNEVQEAEVEVGGNEPGEASIKVEGESHLEITPAEKIPSPLPEATDPYPSRECPELRRERDDYPEVVPPDDKNYHGAAGPPIAPDGDYEHTFEKNMPKRVCFQPRRRGLIIILLLVIIVIAAVIGGSVGGLLMSKRRKVSPQPPRSPAQDPISIAKPPEQRSIAAVECNGNTFMVYQDYKNELRIYRCGSQCTAWHGTEHNTTITWGRKMNTPLALGCQRADASFAWLLNIYYVNEENILSSAWVEFTYNLTDIPHSTSKTYDLAPLPLRVRFAATSDHSGAASYLFISNDTGIVSRVFVPLRRQPPVIHDLRTYASSPMAAISNGVDYQLYWINQQGYLEGAFKNFVSDGSWAGVSTSKYTFSTLPSSMAVTPFGRPESRRILYLEGTQVKQIIHDNGTYSIREQDEAQLPESSTPFGPIAAVPVNTTSSRLYYVVDDEIIEMTWSLDLGWRRGDMPPIPWLSGN
ncbi:hypothetical protein FQN52_004847 [Onygenales sp. PD_12]|nr:hypothetical protein FQN52_004847 [Onygenales sp. PD_12]